MSRIGFRRPWMKGVAFVASLAIAVSATAGDRAQVDLSLRVAMTPDTFVPGGRNTFSITIYNAGPDDAGASRPDDLPIAIYGSSIVFPATQPPPLDISYAVDGGCYLFRYSEPLPNGDWVLLYSYRLDPIPAGQSRTCSSAIEFSALSTIDIAAQWRVSALADDDIQPDNNHFDYTFVAAPPAPPAPVPTRSSLALACLGLALLLAGGAVVRRSASTR